MKSIAVYLPFKQSTMMSPILYPQCNRINLSHSSPSAPPSGVRQESKHKSLTPFLLQHSNKGSESQDL